MHGSAPLSALTARTYASHACRVLPEFFGTVAEEQELLVTFKAHLVEALTTGSDSKNCEGVFDDLYAVDGPVQRLASKPTFGVAATATGGFVATALEDICREIARSMVPAQVRPAARRRTHTPRVHHTQRLTLCLLTHVCSGHRGARP